MLMISREKYVKSLESIRQENIWSLTDLSKDMGVSYPTLRRVMDGEDITYKTLRNIRAYIESKSAMVKDE